MLGHDLAERVDQPGADPGGVLAGLEDDRVARGQRVDDRAHRREDGVVPRADHADNAERLVLDLAGQVRGERAGRHAGRAEDLAGVLAGPGEVVEHRRDLEHGVGVRLTHLLVDDAGQLLDPACDHTTERIEPSTTPVVPDALPPGRGLPGPIDRGPHPLLRVDGEGPDDLSGARVVYLEPARRVVDLLGRHRTVSLVEVVASGWAAGGRLRPSRRSAAFSPIMTEGALVLPRVMRGITDASATRRPEIPRTRSSGSTTDWSLAPMAQVPTGWKRVWVHFRMCAVRASSSGVSEGCRNGRSISFASGPVDTIAIAWRQPSFTAWRSA